MIARIHLKRMLKRCAGYASVACAPLTNDSDQVRACIFVYHRIAEIPFVDPNRDDWNVSPKVFEQQIRALSQAGTIVPLMELPEKLHAQENAEDLLICLTFDDGFSNFAQEALPILTRYQAPATLFVPTHCVGSVDPMSFDRWARDNRHRVSQQAWRAITWQELESCADSPWVTIGSHSHRHLNASECTVDQLQEEASVSRERLISNLGPSSVRCYAYPYGSTRLGQVRSEYVAAIEKAGYELAVTTDLGLADATSNRFTLPRVEAHPLDKPAVIKAKARGSLKPYYLTDKLRRSRRV